MPTVAIRSTDRLDASSRPTRIPTYLQFGLNPNFPTFFANPFRSSDAGDLVPLPQMVHYGIDASLAARPSLQSWAGCMGIAERDDNTDVLDRRYARGRLWRTISCRSIQRRAR